MKKSFIQLGEKMQIARERSDFIITSDPLVILSIANYDEAR